MALPVPGGDNYPTNPPGSLYYPAKRRTVYAHDDGDEFSIHNLRYKRPKYSQYNDTVAYKAADESPFGSFPATSSQVHLHFHHHHHVDPRQPYQPQPQPHHSSCLPLPPPLPAPTHTHHHQQPQPQPQPYHHHVRPHVAPTQVPMERTASGLSISADPTSRCGSTELLDDLTAAQRVRDHLANFRRRNPDSKHERILRSIITPRPNVTPSPLDNDSLASIFSAANEIFFNGRLSQRVMWDWSEEPSPSAAPPFSSSQNDPKVIGTTALRKAKHDHNKGKGFETLIVLSSAILRDRKWSRRLLISTFLHELIHSYMFICCGFGAREEGGHTKGFREIARLIDDWAGGEEGARLYLGRVEADLELFREEGYEEEFYGGGAYPCLGRDRERERDKDRDWERDKERERERDRDRGYEAYGRSSVGQVGFEVVKYQKNQRDRNPAASNGNPWWKEQRVVRPGPVYVFSGALGGGVGGGNEVVEMAEAGFIRL
ncbi:hypothetical protein QBC42DRAFT_325201 [Cladorrhinum samala]|uniref:SprT-like domain-containing protein n=1 Tax=Cladorrhinum samala TaxID=585594 RepID=A0AAV9HQP8_9PEZI|nr:hypothetical protein QBC42DRAFT_325201 [Cladorrhinum samala]